MPTCSSGTLHWHRRWPAPGLAAARECDRRRGARRDQAGGRRALGRDRAGRTSSRRARCWPRWRARRRRRRAHSPRRWRCAARGALARRRDRRAAPGVGDAAERAGPPDDLDRVADADVRSAGLSGAGHDRRRDRDLRGAGAHRDRAARHPRQRHRVPRRAACRVCRSSNRSAWRRRRWRSPSTSSYRYRLAGEETSTASAVTWSASSRSIPGARSSAAGPGSPLDSFAMVRVAAAQTRLRGAIVSSEQVDDFREAAAGVWLLARSDVRQIYEGAAHRTPIHRAAAILTTHEIESARLRGAAASRLRLAVGDAARHAAGLSLSAP